MTAENPETDNGADSAAQQAAESTAQQAAQAGGAGNAAPDDAGSSAPEGNESSSSEAPAAQPAAEPAASTLETQLAERTADLQRLQAEYINYKRRVDRDRALTRTQGKEAVLQSLLTVLDDVRRADEHGELTGGFKAVSDALREAVRSHGLEPFGEVGDAFDPNLHEAVAHAGTSPDVSVQSIDVVMRGGYRTADRILRHAVVSVVDPADEPVDETTSTEPTAESAARTEAE